MPSRDANNATWYLLTTPRDFSPGAGGPVPPERDPTLFYDDTRRVLELLPKAPQQAVEPLPGLAVDPDGTTYRVDPAARTLLVRRCDGSEVPLLCEPQVFADPAGLAIDRRGLLYVADRGSGRVVVLRPEDGTVFAVLDGTLVEPVDVAVAPTGRVYVADRGGQAAGGGKVVVYNARFARVGAFTPRNADGLPHDPPPRPVAVVIDADGSVLVADASYPRLLRFDPDGGPLADVELTTALRSTDPAATDLVPRFDAGRCPPPGSGRDGGAWLAAARRALVLGRLRLGRSFELEGTFTSAALDGGTPGTTWHKVVLDADIPDGCSILVETATAETPAGFADPALVWVGPMLSGEPVSLRGNLLDQLVLSEPGRYVRARLTLRSDGRDTPSVRSVRVIYPRVSYLDLLPRVYRRDPDGAKFLEHFLALFERVFTGIEDRYEEFSRQLDPAAAPADVLDWLACLVDLSFDPSWPLERRRALVAEAMELYRTRGTVRGLARYVEIYTGSRPTIVEEFSRRPPSPAYVGATVLGCSLELQGCRPRETPQSALDRRHAHRFSVYVYLDDRCDAAVALPVVDRIVTTNKPAHTVHTLHTIYPDVRLELQSTVGFDFVLGDRESPRTPLGDGRARGRRGAGAGVSAGVLGVNSVLGDRRPEFARPLEQGL